MERFAFDLSGSIKMQADVYLISWSGRPRPLLIVMLPVMFVRSSWILLTKRVDIIHMQDGILSVMGVVLKFFFRKPLSVVIHGLDITFDNRLYQNVIPWALKRADVVFCISNAAKDEVIKKRG